MVELEPKKSTETKRIERLLAKHFPNFPKDHPPSAYRYNPASIRVRVVSEDFAGKDRVERSELVYPILERHLPEDTWQDITLILLLTPDELDRSPANLEFEHPTPSPL